jgi:hypothetical protein
MTHEEAIETLLATAKVQDGYATKATDEGLRLIHRANAKAQRRVAELLKQMATNLDAFAKANHLQANCLHLTAQALGPDYSATIDALPKAAKDVAARAAAAEAQLAARDAENAKLRALIRRVVEDPHWRTNDNTLWPDLCAALQGESQ